MYLMQATDIILCVWGGVVLMFMFCILSAWLKAQRQKGYWIFLFLSCVCRWESMFCCTELHSVEGGHRDFALREHNYLDVMRSIWKSLAPSWMPLLSEWADCVSQLQLSLSSLSPFGCVAVWNETEPAATTKGPVTTMSSVFYLKGKMGSWGTVLK